MNLAGMTGLIGGITMVESAQATAQTASKPTVVLVHGAFANASIWNDVVAHL